MGLRFGRYETIAPIASGGMATVYLGKAVGAGGFERRVAIKVMHQHIADDPEFEAMFLDEARLAARIHHPNVVATLDIQKTDEAMFLVMDYIDGCSLRDILRPLRKSKGRMPIGNALRILVDALAGLHAAHELCGKDGKPLGLVHRDVSPHNILVGADGISKITDFGVARANARLSSTRGGQLKGKIAYMPPEQGRGDDIDRRADVYAAGVVLWEALVGKRLFRAEHDGALVAMVLTGVTRSPRDEVPYIPEPIDAACMKALAINPADRYPTAAAFADGLEEAAREARVRLPTARQLAAFVHRYRVEIKSEPPAPPGEGEGADEQSTGSDVASAVATGSSPHADADEGTGSGALQGAATGADSVATGTSQLTGIGAVHSGAIPVQTKTLRAVAIGAAAVVVAVGATAWLMSGPSGADISQAQSGPPAVASAAAAGAGRAATTAPAAPDRSVASAEPAASAKPGASGTAAAASAASSAVSTASARAARARPKATGATQPKHHRRGPLGFEPTGL